MTPAATSLGQLLGALPGFTADYLAGTVQTIFHNGTAVDDLATVLCGEKPVVALSAAMPGLAGAIFRKNSFHAALRSDTKSPKTLTNGQKNLIVTLKLFNTIALDRGEQLFHAGVCISTAALSAFLLRRPDLLQEIKRIQLNGNDIGKAAMLQTIALQAKIQLKILDEIAIAND